MLKVLEDTIPSCEFVKQAVQRQVNDLEKWEMVKVNSSGNQNLALR
jgi:hypothetical protein